MDIFDSAFLDKMKEDVLKKEDLKIESTDKLVYKSDINEKSLSKKLRNCPEGTELYSIAHGTVYYEGIETVTNEVKISTEDSGYIRHYLLDEFGKIINSGECVLFPSKDHRTWKDWQLYLMKPGQCVILEAGKYKTVMIIESIDIENSEIKSLCYTSFGKVFYNNQQSWTPSTLSFGTEEDLAELNNAAKEKGYDIDIYNLTVKERIEENTQEFSEEMHDECPVEMHDNTSDKKENEYVPGAKDKYDVRELNAFDKILVRVDSYSCWYCDFFDYIRYGQLYTICSRCPVNYVIPYNESTKHLVGTTQEPPTFYNYKLPTFLKNCL